MALALAQLLILWKDKEIQHANCYEQTNVLEQTKKSCRQKKTVEPRLEQWIWTAQTGIMGIPWRKQTGQRQKDRKKQEETGLM